MAKAITPITLDVVEKKRVQAIAAKQHDTGARKLKIRMTNKGIPIFVEKNCVVTINAFRENDGEAKAFAGEVNDDGTVTVPITYWMLESETTVNCDVSVYDEHENKLSTLSFDIEVEKLNYNGDEISEDENYDLLVTLLAEVAEVKKAEAERVSAENERVEAEKKREKDLTQLIASVSKNSKRITNLEARISPELFTTDVDVAYSKDVPDNVLPYAEITEIGGMTYKDGDALRSVPVSAVESVGVNMCPPLVKGVGLDFNTGNVYVSATSASTDYIRIDISEDEHFLGGMPSNLFNCVFAYDINKKFLGRTGGGVGARNIRSNFISSGINVSYVHYIRLIIYENPSVEGKIDDFDTTTPVINKGSTALPYTPYFKRTLEIPEAVRALDGYGWGVSEDIYNYIDYDKKQFVKRVQKVVFDGSSDEEWFSNNSIDGIDFFNYVGKTAAVNAHIICDRLPFFRKVNREIDCVFTAPIYQPIYVCLSESLSEYSLTAFRAWLAENPLTVYYELATPEITDISDILPADNFIEVESGGTVTMVNEYGYDVPSSITYQLDMEAT